MKITVTKRFPYRGKYREVGQSFDMPEKMAKVLKVIGKVEDFSEPFIPLEPEVKADPPKRRGRPRKVNDEDTSKSSLNYQTRDMTASNVAIQEKD